MSSVTRFLRQIPTGLALYGGSAMSLANIAAAACVFVPAAGNYVGNYPPGLVCPAPTDVILAITNVATDSNLTETTPVVRDMGKTIYAQTADDFADAQAGTGNGTYGYFRQVQVLVPQAITSAQGFLGGANGSVFGVVGGSPNVYSPYLTVYVPTAVDGVLNTISGGASLLPLGPHGQM